MTLDKLFKIPTDLLLIAAMTYFLWDLVRGGMVPKWLFVIGGICMAFLLGLSGRYGHEALRSGISIAVLSIFILSSRQDILSIFIAFLGVFIMFYLYGQLARLTGRFIISAIVILLVLFFFLRTIIF